MPILLDSPVVVNTETKVYDGVWITGFVANFPSTTDGYIRIETKPFNTSTGEILNTEPKIISSDKIWKIIDEVPEAQMAMGHIINAIPKIEEWINANKTPVIPEIIPVVDEEPIVAQSYISKTESKSWWQKLIEFFKKDLF